MRIRPLFVVAAGTLAIVLGGCESTPVTPVPLPPLSAVVVSADVDTLRVGESHQLSAAAYDTLAALVGGATFRWTGLADSVFTVNRFGHVSGVSEGTGLLVVEAGGRRDTAEIAVVAAQSGWFTQASGANGANLHGVFFQPDARTGWAVGDAGKILFTNNAGMTWKPQTSFTSFSLYGVWFTSALEGWAVGVNGTALHTLNGGSTWMHDTTGTAETLRAVRFATRDTGWAVGGNGLVLRTFDRGGSWQKSFPTSAVLHGVSFSGTRDGWAVGTGVIVGTHDAGRSWYLVQPTITSQTLKAVSRRSEELAIAVGALGSTPRTRYFAGPDSTMWELLSAGTSFQFEGVHFPNDMVGYAVGYNGAGAVVRSGDGGLTWQAQVSGTSFRLNDVFFTDDQRGWAVGDQGAIVHTTTGGMP